MALSKVNPNFVSQNLGRRNLIINGDMTVAQRGTSYAYSNNASGYHTLDRWYSANFSSGTLTLSQQTPTVGAVDSTNNLRAVTASTAGASATVYSSQKIENIKQFHNKSVTVSFMVKSSAALTFQLRRQYNYGSGGSSEEYTAFTDVSVTTSWTKFTTTFSAVDYSSKTIGANNYYGILFYWSTNQGTDQRNDATIEVTNVQLEVGDTDTDFEHRSYSEELAACQRYYFRENHTDTHMMSFIGYCASATLAIGVKFLPVSLRSSPTLTINGNWHVLTGNTTQTVTGHSLSDSTGTNLNAIQIRANASSGLTAGDGMTMRDEGDATAWIAFASEL